MKKRGNSKKHTRLKKIQLEQKLVENLVALQKVNIDMAEKFHKLTEQVSGLLALFEMSARSFANNPQLQIVEKDKEFLDKIDKLIEQNKTIAAGLTMMEQKVREKLYGPSENIKDMLNSRNQRRI